jgi:hypothetical protein
VVFATTGDTLPITSDFLVAPKDRVQGQAAIREAARKDENLKRRSAYASNLPFLKPNPPGVTRII